MSATRGFSLALKIAAGAAHSTADTNPKTA